MALFPFGAQVLSRPASAEGPRPVYVLGAYPSGLHAEWIPPAVEVDGEKLRPVRALLVDNEPTPFWSGTGAEGHLEEWRGRVGWRPEWGVARAPAKGANGPSGAWVDEHVLGPLGLAREDACISDCLDTARLNRNQADRIVDTYAPLARQLGLPPCTLEEVPGGENGIVGEAERDHLPRLRRELDSCAPDVVVTLGNAALRVFSLLTDAGPTAPARLTAEGYGRPVPVSVAGREVTWLPLAHPRSGERTPPWPAVHQDWARSPTARRRGWGRH